MKKRFSKIAGAACAFVTLLGSIPFTPVLQADARDQIQYFGACQACGQIEELCENCELCTECQEIFHCEGCGDCFYPDEVCENCRMCPDCDFDYRCEDCGECIYPDELCENCRMCSDCHDKNSACTEGKPQVIPKSVETVDSLLISGLSHPYTGTMPTLTGVTTDEPDKVKIVKIEWYDNETGQPLADDYVFSSGEDIGVSVILEANTGYQFPSNLDSMSVWFEKRSDESYADEVRTVKGKSNQIEVLNTYISYAKPKEVITNVLIQNAPEPYIGEHPVTTGITLEEPDKMTILKIDWWEVGNGVMSANDVFKADTQYFMRVFIEPKEGYRFPLDNMDWLDVYFNKRSDESYADEVLKTTLSDTSICAYNYIWSRERPVETVDNLLISGLSLPYTGTTPTLSGVTTDEPDKVKIVKIEWYDNETGQPLADDYVFSDGEDIGVSVILEAKTGYQFPSDLDSMSIWFGRRNDESYADEIRTVKGKSNQIEVLNTYISYEKPKENIYEVLVKGVPYPYAGTHPVTSGFTLDNPEQAEIVGAIWFNEKTGKLMDETDVFEADTYYHINIYLEPKEGYKFPMGDLKSMTAYVNGRSDESYAEGIFSVYNRETQICIENDYYCTADTQNLVKRVVIGNVPLPVAGQSPVFSGFTFENSDEAEIVSVDWWEKGVSGFMDENDVFEAGKEYCFRVWFKAKDGYKLLSTADQMRAYINGEDDSCLSDEPVNYSAYDDQYCFRKYFKTVLRGDVDGNGEVTASDAQKALAAYAEDMLGNDHGLTTTQFTAADVDRNNMLSAKDAQTILMYFLLNNVMDDPTDWEDLL